MEFSNKQINKLITLKQSSDKAWLKWTTHEGLKSFFGIDNKIELELNGSFEIYFLPNAPIGQRGSEGCKVLSFLPERYFSFSWNAPPQFNQVRNSSTKTWVIIEFISLSNFQTQVKLTHLGWPKDEVWLPIFEYFNKAWDTVLEKLVKSI